MALSVGSSLMSVGKASFLVLALVLIGWATRADRTAAAPAPAAGSSVLVELFT